MIRSEVLRRRLQKVDEYIAVLRHLQHYDWDTFSADPERYGSAERFLHLAIEAMNDIGSHIVADLQLGTVESYRDIPDILVKHGHIPPALGRRWVQMIGFRNVLVHDYLDIDRRIVYQVLHENLEDITQLHRYFAKWL